VDGDWKKAFSQHKKNKTICADLSESSEAYQWRCHSNGLTPNNAGDKNYVKATLLMSKIVL